MSDAQGWAGLAQDEVWPIDRALGVASTVFRAEDPALICRSVPLVSDVVLRRPTVVCLCESFRLSDMLDREFLIWYT